MKPHRKWWLGGGGEGGNKKSKNWTHFTENRLAKICLSKKLIITFLFIKIEYYEVYVLHLDPYKIQMNYIKLNLTIHTIHI